MSDRYSSSSEDLEFRDKVLLVLAAKKEDGVESVTETAAAKYKGNEYEAETHFLLVLNIIYDNGNTQADFMKFLKLIKESRRCISIETVKN